jgi:hypothetical protein
MAKRKKKVEPHIHNWCIETDYEETDMCYCEHPFGGCTCGTYYPIARCTICKKTLDEYEIASRLNAYEVALKYKE